MSGLAGALTCARYSFAPNYYHYCGPDTGGEFGAYLKEELADQRLLEHLRHFETLYPYLKAIAEANGISDPLDPKVVEAYWVGNSLLEKVTPQAMHVALVEKQNLPKRLSKNDIKWLLPKIDRQARLHHSFHVFNVFTRTGHHTVAHTVDSMDQCRIGWGKVVGDNQNNELRIMNKGKLTLTSQKLIYAEGKLKLIPTTREVVVPTEELGKRLKPGSWVSFHWGFVCDVLNEAQVKRLKHYTEYHLTLANETI